jgi:hypothetical protein
MVERDIAHAERTHGIYSTQSRDQARSTHPAGCSTKPDQERGVFTLRNLKEGVEVRLLIRIGQLGQLLPQSGCGSITDPSHETLQRGHSRQ